MFPILAFAAARTGSAAAARLLSRLDLAGHQDDRILYEKRPLPLPDAAPAGRARATLYRRAGVAVFREDAGGKGVELVVRCPPAALDGDDREAGTVSLAFDGGLVLGAPGRPSVLSVTGATPPERRFPRTRRELCLPGNRLSEVLAFEAGVGGEFDWMQADLAPAYGPAAESALRTVVFLPAAPGRPPACAVPLSACGRCPPAQAGGTADRRPAVVLADEVRLADESCDAAWVHHFASPPAQVRPSEERPDRRETGAGVIEVSVGTARLRDLVVLPPKAAFATEDTEVTEDGKIRGRSFSAASVPPVVRSAAAQPLWRVRIEQPERGRIARFCQVLLVSVEGEPASGGACAALLEGAWGAEAEGRVVIFGEESTRRVEGVTRSEVRGVVAVGLAPGARVTFEAAGAPRVERAASDFGAVWLDAAVPGETGFVIEVEPPTAPSGRA